MSKATPCGNDQHELHSAIADFLTHNLCVPAREYHSGGGFWGVEVKLDRINRVLFFGNVDFPWNYDVSELDGGSIESHYLNVPEGADPQTVAEAIRLVALNLKA